MTAKYKELVRQSCLARSNRFGAAFFEQHILLVERFALRLGETLGADRDILLAAVYLHDLAAIEDFSCLAEHPRRGAERAAEILAEAGHAPGWIKAVQHAIETHSVPLAAGQDTAEAVCLSNADALSQLANPVYWLYYAFNVRGFDYAAGRQWYAERVESVWGRLIEPARELGQAHYELAIELLKPR